MTNTTELAPGQTRTGLDRLVSIILEDEGLVRRASPDDIAAGALAADGMNRLILDAIRATGVANNGDLTAADVRDLNHWLVTHHADTWAALHGDDERGSETGFHRVQNDGATTVLFDKNAINKVADGLYHLGFEASDRRLLNEDGNPNIRFIRAAEWLDALLADDLAAGTLANPAAERYLAGSTGTGLDRLIDLINADDGLSRRLGNDDIQTAAVAADAMNALIIEAIRATGVANDGTLTAADILDLSAYLGAHHAERWAELHGDDEAGQETGFHLIQKDGASTRLFDKNAINKVADGIYHLGFDTDGRRLLNEDGDRNVSTRSVAEWLGTLLADDLAAGTLANPAVDPYLGGSTGTGLDQLVRIITADEGLQKRIATSDIRDGAAAADAMNALIIDAIRATGSADDGILTADDMARISDWLVARHADTWAVLHGDDTDDGRETGFHKVQGDGASTRLFDRNAINKVADGLYHLGFTHDGRFLQNEDGDRNISLRTSAEWLGSLLADDFASGVLSSHAAALVLVGQADTPVI